MASSFDKQNYNELIRIDKNYHFISFYYISNL